MIDVKGGRCSLAVEIVVRPLADEPIVIVVGVENKAKTLLFYIGNTGGLLGRGLCLGKYRKKNRSQNCDYRNDYEKLNERKSVRCLNIIANVSFDS